MQRGIRFDDLLGEVRGRARGDGRTGGGGGGRRGASWSSTPASASARPGSRTWRCSAACDELAALGRPLLVGASRKSFLARALEREGAPEPPIRPPPGWAAASPRPPGRSPAGADSCASTTSPRRSSSSPSGAPSADRPGARGRRELRPLRRDAHLARRHRHPGGGGHHLQPAAPDPRHPRRADAARAACSSAWCTTGAQLAELPTLQGILENLLIVLPFAIIVLFQQEIRRALADFGRNPLWGLAKQQKVVASFGEIVLAATTLSSRRDRRPDRHRAPARAAQLHRERHRPRRRSSPTTC